MFRQEKQKALVFGWTLKCVLRVRLWQIKFLQALIIVDNDFLYFCLTIAASRGSVRAIMKNSADDESLNVNSGYKRSLFQTSSKSVQPFQPKRITNKRTDKLYRQ